MKDCMYRDFCYKGNCQSSCVRYKETKYILDNSGIPEKRRRVRTFDVPKGEEQLYDKLERVSKSIDKYVYEGYNIVLWSEKTGNGKTSWAIQFLLSYVNKIWAGNGFKDRIRFIYVPDYLNRVKAAMKIKDEELDSINETIKDVDLLVLDDLGATQMSEFDVSLLSTIIDQRTLKGNSTIITTNLTRSQLTEMIGSRMVDRIYGNGITLHFNSESNRGL